MNVNLKPCKELNVDTLSYMKKALVFLLILAVAGGLFAQDMIFNGQVWGGLGVLITDGEDEEPIIGNYSARENFTARAEVNARYTNAEGNAGFRVLLRGQANDAANFEGGRTFLPVYELWFKGLNDIVEFRGGRLDSGGPFGTAGGIDTSWDIGGGGGFYVNVQPFTGFDIRFTTNTESSLRGPFRELADGRYIFGVRYLLPDLLDIIAILGQGRRHADPAGPDDPPATVPRGRDSTDVLLGFKILALRGAGVTNLNLDLALLNIQTPDEMPDMGLQVGQRLDFVTGDLGLGIRFRQDFVLWDEAAPDYYVPDLSFYGYFQYSIRGIMANNGLLVPRVNIGYNMGSGLRTGYSDPNYRGTWDGVNKADPTSGTRRADSTGFHQDYSNLMVSPNIQLRFNGRDNQLIEFGYVVQVDMSDEGTRSTGQRSVNNLIYIDYRVAF